jgi:hypothetical protein
MKINKKGELVLPRMAWAVKASLHESVASQLTSLLKRYEDKSALANSTAGVAIYDELGFAFLEFQLRVTELANEHLEAALTCNSLYAERRRGRPVVKPVYPENIRRLIEPKPYRVKRKRGRPVLHGTKIDEKVYREVEKRRTEVTGNAVRVTIKTAIESIIMEQARESSKSYSAMRSQLFNSIRSQYSRGKKTAKPRSK